MPPSMAMGNKSKLPGAICLPEDQLRAKRTGRKFVFGAKELLQTAAARLLLSLKQFVPEHVQVMRLCRSRNLAVHGPKLMDGRPLRRLPSP